MWTLTKISGGIFAIILILAFSAFFWGWIVMLGCGIVHSYSHGFPALTFWPCVGIGVLLSLILG